MVFIKSEVPTIFDAISFPQLFGGNVMNVVLINTICDGNTTLEDTTIVICLLFSKFNICMFGTLWFLGFSTIIKDKTNSDLIIIFNKCWWNGIFLHQISNPISHCATLDKLICWNFVCNNGCHIVNPTHAMFHELFKPLSCDSKPSTSKSYKFKSDWLYHTFEDGLHNIWW